MRIRRWEGHMDLITPILLIVGSILAISGLIIAKKPDAKALIDKLSPYQAMIGVFMLATGIWWLLRWGRQLIHLDSAFLAACIWGVIGVSILLGALFGMPQIAKWIPGESSAEQKALELSQKVAPYQVLLGLIGLASAFIYLLFRFNVLHVHG
jgi:thiol:disulfide interchange protein